MMLIAPVAVILVAENLGHLKAVAGMTGRNMDPYMGRAFVGDGLATMLSGSVGFLSASGHFLYRTIVSPEGRICDSYFHGRTR